LVQSEEIEQQKNLRLANLLGFAQLPSRTALLQELLEIHVLLDEVCGVLSPTTD
jgi:hypothetical protein